MSDGESSDDWDKDDDWEPDIPAAAVPVAKKFAEEDEPEREEERVVSGKYAGKTMQQLVSELERRDASGDGGKASGAKARRKAIKERDDAEREARAEANRARQEEALAATKMTPEEIAAAEAQSRADRQRKVEESDLALAAEFIGDAGDKPDVLLIEAMEPETKADFEKMSKSIVTKATKYSSSPFFSQFIIDTCRDLALDMTTEDIKKISSTLTILANAKQKAAQPKKKGSKLKSLGGGKGGNSALAASRGAGNDNDEYDDFM